MNNLAVMPGIPAMPSLNVERPAGLIRVVMPRLNKCDRVEEYVKQLKTSDYDIQWAEVTETVVLSVADWNGFMRGLLEDRDWLAGKGGASNWNPEHATLELEHTGAWSKADWAQYHATMYLLAVEVVCAGARVYVDPQGYNYARYVGFLADGMPEGRTRQEREKDEAVARVAERKALIDQQIANPPTVVPEHGLRFYWNGIKANGGGLQKAYYSLGNVYDYPADVISINARDWGSFSAEVGKCFHVSNNSDMQTDYHDNDHIRVCSNHPLYAVVLEAFRAQERHEEKRKADRTAKHEPKVNIAHILTAATIQ